MSIPRVSNSAAALTLEIVGECCTTRARVCRLRLSHHTVDTPVFMPVGTQGAMKAVTVGQLEAMDCQIILGNTYHLGHRPGPEILTRAGGLHNFMNWPRALLTDSGGFQMVSLVELSEVTEAGVRFLSPHDKTEMLLTPEHSMALQHAIGADIMMQLDDVVHSLTEGPRVEEAMGRSIRWLDRCIEAHKNTDRQNLFAIVQGGLNEDLRLRCVQEMLKRKDQIPGFAIGGLSGGEEKSKFWRMVALCTGLLPRDKPRYLMGVGYAVDLVVCVALGCDMFDCVYPTRTARFGQALVPWGQLNLRSGQFANDFAPIDPACACPTCQRYTRAYLHTIVCSTPVGASLLTQHNITFQLTLMRGIRAAILERRFPQFVRQFIARQYPPPDCRVPDWVTEALASVGVPLDAKE